MKLLRAIVESPYEPNDTNVLWIDTSIDGVPVLRKYANGFWTYVSSSSTTFIVNVDILPEASKQTLGKMYATPSQNPHEGDTTDEWLTVISYDSDGNPTYSWEQIGQNPDLSQFITKSVNNLENYYLKTQTFTQEEIIQRINESKNLVYLVVDELPQASSETLNSIYLVEDSQQENVYNMYITQYENSTYSWVNIGNTSIALSQYAIKDVDAVEGNIAAFDANGNPVDGGISVEYISQLGQELDEGKISFTEVRSANIHNSAPATPATSSEPTDGSDWTGHALNGTGGVYANASYTTCDYIEIIGGQNYKCSVNLRIVEFYTDTKSRISAISTTVNAGVAISAPATAKYVRFTYSIAGVPPTPAEVKFGKYADNINVPYILDYEDYDSKGRKIALSSDVSSAIIESENKGKILKFVKTKIGGSDFYYVYCGDEHLRISYPHTAQNNNLNFSELRKKGKNYIVTDDIAAMHIFNTTLGGNHGQPIAKATITGHGLTESDLGSAWVFSGSGESNGKTFYVVKIFDDNNVGFLSENKGTYSSPSWYSLSSGTLTKVGASTTMEVNSVSASQLWPSARNIALKVVVDGVSFNLEDIEYGQEIYGNTVDFVETFDTVNPVSQLNHIIDASVPESMAIRTEHIFRVLKDINIVFITTYFPYEEIQFSDFLFAMKKTFGTLSQVKYYIPNSLPLSTDGGATFTFDCRTPSNFPTGASGMIWVDDTRVAENSHPIHRVLMYDTSNNNGMAIGIFQEMGVGRKLNNYTGKYFELRNDSGAVYPTPVRNGKVGNTLLPGDIYTGVMYWGFFDADLSSDDNRMSMYHFSINDVEYIYADYKGSKLDKIVLDDTFNGKTVELVEASNAGLRKMDGAVVSDEVRNDVYNGGFYVNAEYVSGETCYIICRISK